MTTATGAPEPDADEASREGHEVVAQDTEVDDPTAAHEHDEIKLLQQINEVERVGQS